MPYFIGGVTADHHNLVARTPAEFKSMNDIDVLTRHEVLSIQAEDHTVTVRDLSSGREFEVPYTRLLLTTGADAVVPPVEGAGLEGVFTLRRLEDSVRIKEFISGHRPRRSVIVGGGPIGMEMCEALAALGLEVTVVEAAGQVMPYLSPEMASKVQARIEAEGVSCVLGQKVEGIEADGRGGLRGVATAAGDIAADLVLMAVGVRPSTRLASDAGVELGVKGAVKVDGRMRTSVEDIFAAGDCATTSDTITGLETWVPLGSTSRKQGRVAADSMFGGSSEFLGVQGTSVVKCFDLTIGRTGLDQKQATDAGFLPAVVEIEADSLHEYYPGRDSMSLKLLADGESGRLLGAEIVGRVRSIAEKRLDILAVAIGVGMTADDLQYVDLAYAPPYSTAVDVPIIAANVMTAKIRGSGCGCDTHGLS